MRVTQTMLTQQLLYNVSNVMQGIQTDQEQLSTGKVLNQASDNPLAVSQDMAVSAALSETAAYQNTISAGQSWMQSTMSATQSMITSLQSIHQNVLQALNTPSANPSELQAVAATVQQSIAQVYSVLDTKQGNDYLFGGSLTGTPPAPYAQGSVFQYGSSGTVYNSVGSGNSPDGVNQGIPPSSIATSMSGTLALSTGTSYELTFQANSISTSTGTVQPTFSGTVELVDTSNPGTILASGTVTGGQFGNSVTLAGTSGSLSLTLGDLFTTPPGTSGAHYSQTDTFSLSAGGSAVDPHLATLPYQVADGVQIPVNLTAAQLFHSTAPGATKDLQSTLSSIVNDLVSASQALKQSQGTSGSSGSSTSTSFQQAYQSSLTRLQQDLGNLQANTDQVVNDNSTVGTQMQRMTAMKNQIAQYAQNLTDQKSKLEDANMAQVITKFSTDQSVYQAALQMGAKVILPSLISYL